MKFNHLNVPTHWQNYWTRFPEGYTILEALIQWVSQVDNMVDNQNTLNETVETYGNRLDDFIGKFDGRLQEEVTHILSDWQNSGFLHFIISEALQNEIDDVKADLDQLDKVKIDEVVQDGSTVIFKSNGTVLGIFDLSVTANAQLVRDYIDSLVTAGTIQGVSVADNSVGFTQLKTATADLNILDSTLLSAEQVELFDPSTVVSGYGISTSTGDLVVSSKLKTTAFIPIVKGAIIDFKVFYDRNGFTYTSLNAEKIAFYDSSLNFIKDYSFNVFENSGAPVNGYFRIVMDINRESVSIKTNKSVKLDKKYIQNEGTLPQDYYMGDDLIELYNSGANTQGKTFSGYTNTLVNFGAEVTDYMFIPANSNVSITINNTTLENATVISTTKVAFYDSDLKHLATAPLKDVPISDFTRNENTYIRFALVNGDVLNSVKSDKVAKIDTKFLPVQTGGGSSQDDSGYDVFVFMGQSNMAGRGVQTTEHPELAPDASGIAYEYRAITAPNELTPLVEPFGKNENTVDGINDGAMKTGSMVSSFAKAYHEVTGKKLIGISASKGGSSILEWISGTPFLNDTISRINKFKNFAAENGIKVRGYYVVWNQGEGDGNMVQSTYEGHLNNMMNALKPLGIEKLFLVRIGHTVDDPESYSIMLEGQTNIGRNNKDVVLVGTKFAELALSGYLKDIVHFVQAGYNIQGEQAGTNTAYYLNNLKEPLIYDTEYNSLYYSHKL